MPTLEHMNAKKDKLREEIENLLVSGHIKGLNRLSYNDLLMLRDGIRRVISVENGEAAKVWDEDVPIDIISHKSSLPVYVVNKIRNAGFISQRDKISAIRLVRELLAQPDGSTMDLKSAKEAVEKEFGW